MAAVAMIKINPDELSITQKFAISIISANNQPLKGKLWLQKGLFLLSKNIKNLDEDIIFESDLMGPYSEIVDEELEQLELMGLVKKDGNKISLTRYGGEISTIIKNNISNEEQDMINEFKELLSDLTDDELLAFIYFSFPDYTEESIKIRDILSKRKEIALKLFMKDKISIGKASEIAGISIEDIKKILIKKGISIN